MGRCSDPHMIRANDKASRHLCHTRLAGAGARRGAWRGWSQGTVLRDEAVEAAVRQALNAQRTGRKRLAGRSSQIAVLVMRRGWCSWMSRGKRVRPTGSHSLSTHCTMRLEDLQSGARRMIHRLAYRSINKTSKLIRLTTQKRETAIRRVRRTGVQHPAI